MCSINRRPTLRMTTFSQRADPCAGTSRRDWQTVLAEAVTDPDELCRLLDLPASLADEARRAAGSFRLLVPRPYVNRIRPGDPNDPLLRQVLPIAAESEPVEGFGRDPLCEAIATPTPGLLSKYRGRSLMVTTGRCGVHCRFCFRRHHPTPCLAGGENHLKEALDHLAQDPSIHEVILSGGDPLALDDGALGELAQEIAGLDHVRRIRLHTRMPVVVPQRVTDEFLAWASRSRLTVVMVLHINHPAEIDGAVATAIGQLSDAGIPLLSQSVLLRGINNDSDVLAELFERLIDHRVMPYYLHQLDRVAGAAHFEVPESEGIKLIENLRCRLPGYAVPRYVHDIPGNRGKQVLA